MFPQETRKRNPRKGPRKGKLVSVGDSEDEDSEDEHKYKKFCQYHGTCGYTTDECTT